MIPGLLTFEQVQLINILSSVHGIETFCAFVFIVWLITPSTSTPSGYQPRE